MIESTDSNPPVQPGQRLELDITDLAFGGDGIGRVDGFVVFVPFVIEGERVEVEIVEVKRRFATADPVRVVRPSPHRVEPRCPYYMKCAGCQYQHVSYPHQLEAKRKQIGDIFERLGGIPNPPIDPVVASPRTYEYRNKIVLHGPGNRGFWTVRGRSVMEIEECAIAREPINAKLAEVASHPESYPDETAKHLTIRANSDGQVWCFTHAQPTEEITETVLGSPFVVPLGSFFQVNQEVISLALEHARRVFTASGCRVVVDAYCGVGLFALMLGDLAEHCYGIESDPYAIAAANANREALGRKNNDFYVGTTERLLFYTLRQCELEQTCLILDPPRSGCAKAVLKVLRNQRPRKILYVSCAPARLARDVKEMVATGYSLERVTPFDMFPQTQHCEAVAELVAQ